MSVKLMTHDLNGKKINYNSETLFLVQVTSGKSKYRTRYAFTGDLPRAIIYYNNFDLGYGFKKRLYMVSSIENTVVKGCSLVSAKGYSHV